MLCNALEAPMNKFDPTTTISAEFGIFGIPMSEDDSKVVLLPVPWEVTTSYGNGTSMGPALIRQASEQIDLFDLETGKSYEQGYHMRPISDEILSLNKNMKVKAQKLIAMKTSLSDDTQTMDSLLNEVNSACAEMSDWVYKNSKEILEKNKLLGLVGGDHSSPLGAIRAVSEKHQGDIGVLHIDAHSDTRKSYQGFEQSHASIMYNVMQLPIAPKKLVQIGIRDFCEEEYNFVTNHKGIKTFFDIELKRDLLSGKTWSTICENILKELPQKVYISFDIDGLDPRYCPQTGTPVPGGLEIDQVFFLFKALADSGRQIVGFDLNEVSTGDINANLEEISEWDGNVGARILYKLCGWSVVTNK